MKISIRVSILTLFVALLLIVGSVIAGLNFYILNRVLLQTSQNVLTYAGNFVEQQITNYLQPISHYTVFTGKLIDNHLITPGHNKAFEHYLFQLVADPSHNISGAYWGTPNGDFYYIEKGKNNTFVSSYVIRKENQPLISIERTLNQNGQYLTNHTYKSSEYDPRVRPWYKAAVAKKASTWSEPYLFHPFGRAKPQLGITSSYPIYNQKTGKLAGVLGLDVELNTLSEFVAKLSFTPHTTTFIVDQHHHLLAAKILKDDPRILGKEVVPTVDALNNPWALAALNRIHSDRPVFSYKFNDQPYIATFKNIQQMTGENWKIAIALPLSDITRPLRNNLIISLSIAIITLLLGIFLVSLISKKIATPIKKLVLDAKYIQRLEFDKPIKLVSHISEIVALKKAFEAMRNALTSFSRYVPFSLVQHMVASGEVAQVGGRKKDITLLFSDIRGFTSITENMTPEIMMPYLSEYFDVMTKTVVSTHGTLDKYIGDALMAFWGAPKPDKQQAFHACESALLMLEALQILNHDWEAKGSPVVSVGIGIHTGHAVVGNVGSIERLSYTAMGDNVNLASRLEALNKQYGTHIIISETTHALVKDQYAFRLVDRVAVRGKRKGVYVYELFESAQHSPFGERLDTYNATFQAAFNTYAAGQFDEALPQFQAMQQLYPDDKLITMYVRRCQIFQKTHPIHWNGIFMQDKAIKE